MRLVSPRSSNGWTWTWTIPSRRCVPKSLNGLNRSNLLIGAITGISVNKMPFFKKSHGKAPIPYNLFLGPAVIHIAAYENLTALIQGP
jgi:hypothetical protein